MTSSKQLSWLGGKKCRFHPHTLAVGICHHCEIYVCDECGKQKGGYTVCKVCDLQEKSICSLLFFIPLFIVIIITFGIGNPFSWIISGIGLIICTGIWIFFRTRARKAIDQAPL